MTQGSVPTVGMGRVPSVDTRVTHEITLVAERPDRTGERRGRLGADRAGTDRGAGQSGRAGWSATTNPPFDGHTGWVSSARTRQTPFIRHAEQDLRISQGSRIRNPAFDGHAGKRP
jgi:hypothetical protein